MFTFAHYLLVSKIDDFDLSTRTRADASTMTNRSFSRKMAQPSPWLRHYGSKRPLGPHSSAERKLQQCQFGNLFKIAQSGPAREVRIPTHNLALRNDLAFFIPLNVSSTGLEIKSTRAVNFEHSTRTLRIFRLQKEHAG
jgi:hypothetical protein